MHRAILFAKRNKLLVAATALLMAGAGCVSAVHTTTEQLTKDAMLPITVPVGAYKQAVDVASSTDAAQRNQMDQSGMLDR